MKIHNPYENLTGGHWLRGNLHAHSTRSDGWRPPQAVIDDYARRKYDFLMLSDHDVFSAPEDYAQLDSRGMLLISGNEVSAEGPHILHVYADRRVNPARLRQEVFKEIKATQGFAVVAHPNWTTTFNHCSAERIVEWSDYLGIEIFNGLVEWHYGSACAEDKWDIALAAGKRVWGFANDDSHRGTYDVELGWNMVYTYEKSVTGLVEAMRAGRFYPSTGVNITGAKIEGDQITITTSNAHRIAAIADSGVRFDCVDGPTMTVTALKGLNYVRFKCFGQGEQVAWSQPFYIEYPPAPAHSAKPHAHAKDFIRNWDVSQLQPIRLDQAVLPSLTDTALGFKPLTAVDKGPTEGFMDIRLITNANPGVVYLSTPLNFSSPTKGKIHIGAGGPVKVWLNGTLIFQGPGAPPAAPDRFALHAQFNTENRLTIALDAAIAKTWGLYARVERDA